MTTIPSTPRLAVARTIRALKRYRDMTDAEIAARAGMKPGTVAAKMTGANGCSAEDLFALAHAMGVEPWVLMLPKRDALKWALDNSRPVGPPPPDGGPVIDLTTYA